LEFVQLATRPVHQTNQPCRKISKNRANQDQTIEGKYGGKAAFDERRRDHHFQTVVRLLKQCVACGHTVNKIRLNIAAENLVVARLLRGQW
jgi:hypothetical protein